MKWNEYMHIVFLAWLTRGENKNRQKWAINWNNRSETLLPEPKALRYDAMRCHHHNHRIGNLVGLCRQHKSVVGWTLLTSTKRSAFKSAFLLCCFAVLPLNGNYGRILILVYKFYCTCCVRLTAPEYAEKTFIAGFFLWNRVLKKIDHPMYLHTTLRSARTHQHTKKECNRYCYNRHVIDTRL